METIDMETPEQPDNYEPWPQVRQMLVFQIKLYVDAARDLLFSPLSIIAMVVDLVQKHSPEESYFQRLLSFGRETERTINLFNQHDHDDEKSADLDWLLGEVEEKLRKKFEERKRR